MSLVMSRDRFWNLRREYLNRYKEWSWPFNFYRLVFTDLDEQTVKEMFDNLGEGKMVAINCVISLMEERCQEFVLRYFLKAQSVTDIAEETVSSVHKVERFLLASLAFAASYERKEILRHGISVFTDLGGDPENESVEHRIENLKAERLHRMKMHIATVNDYASISLTELIQTSSDMRMWFMLSRLHIETLMDFEGMERKRIWGQEGCGSKTMTRLSELLSEYGIDISKEHISLYDEVPKPVSKDEVKYISLITGLDERISTFSDVVMLAAKWLSRDESQIKIVGIGVRPKDSGGLQGYARFDILDRDVCTVTWDIKEGLTFGYGSTRVEK